MDLTYWLAKIMDNESISGICPSNLIKCSNPVGYWVLYPGGTPQTKFAMYKRPTAEQIKNTQDLLGWGWEEYKNE